MESGTSCLVDLKNRLKTGMWSDSTKIPKRELGVPRIRLIHILIYVACCLGARRGRNVMRMKLLTSFLCSACTGCVQEASWKSKCREDQSWSVLIFLKLKDKTRRPPLPLVAFIIRKVSFFLRGRMILWSWKPDDLTCNPDVDTDFPVWPWKNLSLHSDLQPVKCNNHFCYLWGALRS